MQYKVISFYQYAAIENPEPLRDQLREYCQKNQILGRILIGKEGLNGAVCGEKANIAEFKQFLTGLFNSVTAAYFLNFSIRHFYRLTE